MTHEDLQPAAQRTYASLKTVFAQSRNYWRLGQTFDTVIDYLAVTGDPDAGAFAQLALERYAASRGSWYDDYAWWGIANLKAAQNPRLFGDSTRLFYNHALECWQKMAPGTAVWDAAQKFPSLQAAKPAVEHGVWNHTYDPKEDSSYNPLNPRADSLSPYQNTVTNALYLVLAARLSRYPGNTDPQFAQAAEREYAFLQTWFNLSRPGFDPLLNVFSPARDKAVVRERVSCYDSGVKLNSYRPDLAWAGDQGLIIGGLLERMEIVGREHPTYPAMLTVVRQILAGTREYLAVDGRLLPWWPDPAPGTGARRPAGDAEDYRTGPGVYMRYLLHAHLVNHADLAQDLLPYHAFVYENARQVLQAPSPTAGKADAVMVALTNDLAILTAAIVMA
jgi:hypothetical protein